MKANKIIIVPTTHWDREWYIPFNEFRAYLVLMLDKLIKILKDDPDFTNFTLDGQVIPLEDYLQVKPKNREIIEKFIKEKRISIGPMYILPDEFLVSGESIIRNILLGHIMGREYGNGKVMKAGYIPDPFGHIAQLPQILQGFDIPSVLFMRGFGNEFEENNLNMEFIWNAPGKSASILGIHLIQGYSSAANLDTSLSDGLYENALKQIQKSVRRLEKYTATDIVLINNGSDHLYAQPEVPAILKQWNKENPDKIMEINDFEYYVSQVLSIKPNLKEFSGELRAGKYHPLLSGVFSARMWIKQKNTEIESLYEKYTEPVSTITWILDKYNQFDYPNTYIWTGLKWLLKNHPHDSICGCSIDEVHEEMKIRFQWAEQIGNEITKNSFIYLIDLIKFKALDDGKYALIIYNPLPWTRRDISYFDVIDLAKKDIVKSESGLMLTDSDDNIIDYQIYEVKEKPRYWQEPNSTYRYTFIADVPACGYKVYYIDPNNSMKAFVKNTDEFKLSQKSIENVFYKVEIKDNGRINVFDKKSKTFYENILEIEDMGDWGDEYDYSGPIRDDKDKKITSKNATQFAVYPFIDGPSQKTLKLKMTLKLPKSLAKGRLKREDILVDNPIQIFISLYKEINRIDVKIKLHNKSKDHRIRVIFPSNIKADKVYADGHFYIVPRDIKLPDSKGWAQKILPTNHQKDFVCVHDDKTCFAVINKGLPEYEAIKDNDGTIKLAITLLRCVGWLARGDLATRTGIRSAIAGPPLYTPGAQCLGKHEFDLSLCIRTEKKGYLDSDIAIIGKEFNNPLMTVIPDTVKSVIRSNDKLLLTPSAIFQIFKTVPVRVFEPYLPESLSFLEIDNKNISLSALKKSEEGDFLIIRVYNLASSLQKAKIVLFRNFNIKDVNIVNFLEENPGNNIKAKILHFKNNIIEFEIDANVIATFKLKFEKY